MFKNDSTLTESQASLKVNTGRVENKNKNVEKHHSAGDGGFCSVLVWIKLLRDCRLWGAELLLDPEEASSPGAGAAVLWNSL